MIREALVEYCAPTLAGIKTGSICTIQNGPKGIDDEIRELNGCLVKKGLSLIPLKKTAKTTIVYLYRPDRLKMDLQAPEAQKILEEKGYPCRNAGCCIVALVKRLMMDKDFPHEIGLFLGYPPSDVEGFMKSPWEGVKCCGCWKVYSNVGKAKIIFDQYKKCTEIYRSEKNKGKPLENMIVDTRHEFPGCSNRFFNNIQEV